jgi:hypothetical protein
MKKNILIVGCIISCFILVSLSYQPIIADEQIDAIPIIEDTQTTISDDDCGCNDESSRWGFPIICSVLGMFLLITMILVISMNQNQFLNLLEFVNSIGNSLNCW